MQIIILAHIFEKVKIVKKYGFMETYGFFRLWFKLEFDLSHLQLIEIKTHKMKLINYFKSYSNPNL